MSVPLAIAEAGRAAALPARVVSEAVAITAGVEAALAADRCCGVHRTAGPPGASCPSPPPASAKLVAALTNATQIVAVADLLPRVSDGDPAAWDEILRRYGKLVTATVRSFRLQNADALDAVQTTWLRLAENAHRVQSPERLAGWLATTARRECLRILRQIKSTPAPIDVADPSVGPERRAIDADTARTLWNLVEELSPRQRTLLRALFTDHPRPYAEVARTTGIPSGAIGPTRGRALAQLRRRLEQPHVRSTFLRQDTGHAKIAVNAAG